MGYSYAEKLLTDAKSYDDYKAKAKVLKMAYNAAVTENNSDLIDDILKYAAYCGIDLSKVSGYDF